MRQSEPGALPRAEARDISPAEQHSATGRRDLAAEYVDERRLPRPVRTDDRATFALRDPHGDAVDRDDAAEAAAQIADLDHRVRTRISASRPRPTIPCRANRTNAMKTTPRMASEIRSSGGSSDGTTRSMSDTSADPAIGPPRLPAPPTRTVTNARTELPSPASCADTKRVE